MTDRDSSPRAPALSVPSAILIGSVIVGAFTSVAVYLALRPAPIASPALPSAPAVDLARASTTTTSAPQPAVESQPAPTATAPVAPQAVATAAVPTVAAPADASNAAVKQAVAAQIEAARAKLVKDCWSPSVAAKPAPAKAAYVVNVTFGPDGAQVMQGIAADRANERADLDTCVSQKLPIFKVAPTGGTVYVEVPFTLP